MRVFQNVIGWCVTCLAFCAFLTTSGRAAPVEIILPQGHEVEVLGLVYSPDGRVLISSGESDAIRVWDAESGDLLRALPGHPERVRGLTMSGDGRLIASSSTDGLVKVWDYRAGRLLQTFTNHVGKWVRAVAFSPDGRRLVPAAYDGKLSVWDVASGAVLHTFPMPGRVADVLFTPDARFIVTASREESNPVIRFLEAESGKVSRTLDHSNLLANIALSRDGRWLASCRGQGVVRLWALPEGRLVHTLTTQDRGTVLAVALSPDGRTLAAASAYVVSLWDTESGRLLRQLAGHQDTVETIAFRPDGKEIASGGSDATIRQWNVQDGTLKRVLSRRSPGVSITSVALSQDGGLEALGTANGLVRVWNTRGGDLAYDLVGHEGAVQALGVTPDGVWLCSGSADRTLRVWRLANGALSTTYPNFDRGDGMGVLAIGGGNGWVATAAGPWGDGTVNPVIKLWPVMFDRPIHLLRGHRAAVRSVAFRPGSDLLASADEAGTVKLWNSRTAECLRSVTSATPAQTLAFSPGGQWLVAGMADGRVRVLETNTLSTAREWHAHQRPVPSLVISDDGRWLATASADQTVAVWDFASGREVHRFTHVTSQYLPLAFHRDQPVLAFAQRDDTVVHARVETGEVLFQRVLFPDGEWLAWNPATARYLASPRGDAHDRLRFQDQLVPAYPLEFYRGELSSGTNRMSALSAPAPPLAPKNLRLWWYRHPYKNLWLYAGAGAFLAWIAWRLRRGWLAERGRRAQEIFSRQMLLAHETERQRIAAELHDGLGQTLLVIKNQIVLAQRASAGPASNPGSLNEISQAVSQSIEEVRGISQNLRPYQLDRLGLTKAIQSAARRIADSGALRIEVRLESIDGLFPPEGEIHLYRVVQESLNNILKHAAAATAEVSVQKAATHITIRIEDDGRGFEYRRSAGGTDGSRGFGLTSLGERMRILRGRFHCDSAPGQGTRLKFEVPIPSSHA